MKRELDELTIHIYPNSNGDINYEIHETPEDIDNGQDELDGGVCTGTLQEALEMATDQAKELIKKDEKEQKISEGILQKKLNIIEPLLKDLNMVVACDEEWNTLFGKFDISIDEDTGRPVIFGLSGSELDQ